MVRKWKGVGHLLLILFIMQLVGSVAGHSNANHGPLLSNESTLIQTLENGTILELDLDSYEIEFGSKLTVSYGILDNSSSYLANVSYHLYLVTNSIYNGDFILDDSNSSLLINSTSTNFQMFTIIDTIPGSAPSLGPGNYSIVFTVLPGTNDTISIYENFNIISHLGANIDVTYTDLFTNTKISDPISLSVNETRGIEVTLTNVGSGNAIDIEFSLSSINGPLEYNSSITTFSTPVLTTLDHISFNFSVKPPDFGIGNIEFKLVFNNTIGSQFQGASYILVEALPYITAEAFYDSPVIVGNSTRLNVVVTNHENVNIIGQLSLKSLQFSINPPNTDLQNFPSGISDHEFAAVAFENGTTSITVVFTYYDIDGGETADIYLTTLVIRVDLTIPPQLEEEFDPLLVSALILYGILLIIILVLFVREDIRKAFINRVASSIVEPDIDYNNKFVIVDGSNIAWEELTESGKPKIENIEMSIQTLEQYGFEEITVVADAALRYQIENPKDLDDRVKKGIIKVLPAKVDGDSFILRLSKTTGALILTNDLFKEYREEFLWVDERRIPYSIINGHFYLHPVYNPDIPS